MSNFRMVKDFHEKMGVVCNKKLGDITDREKLTRIKLISEEFTELIDAMHANDIVEVADALADLLYVVYGCADKYGMDIDKVFMEVHHSNMTKHPVNSGVLKVQKGSNYRPPDIEEALGIKGD